jgi:hypothetical protein
LYEWSPETLENRVFLLRELLQRCEDEGVEAAQNLLNEDDPLWDPVEVERLIGVAQILLEGLLLQVDNQLDARILSTDGHQSGTLRVELLPLAQDGSVGVPDEEVVEDPEELLGTKMALLLKVPYASQIPEALANEVRVEYDYFIDDKPHRIPCIPGHNRNPKFEYEKTFVQDPVTSRFLEYLKTKTLVFRVYGRDEKARRVSTLFRPLTGRSVADEPCFGGASTVKSSQEALHGDPLVKTNGSSPPASSPLIAPSVESQPNAQASSPVEVEPPDRESPPAPAADPPMAPATPKADAPSISQLRREQEQAAQAREQEAPKGKQGSKACQIL